MRLMLVSSISEVRADGPHISDEHFARTITGVTLCLCRLREARLCRCENRNSGMSLYAIHEWRSRSNKHGKEWR